MSSIVQRLVTGQDLPAARLQIDNSFFNLGRRIVDEINKLPPRVPADLAINTALTISGVGTLAAIAEIGPGPLDFGVGGFISSFAGRLAEYTLFRPIDRVFRVKFRTTAPGIRTLREGVRNGTLGVEFAKSALYENNIADEYVDSILRSWQRDGAITAIREQAALKLAELNAAEAEYNFSVAAVEDDLNELISTLKSDINTELKTLEADRITTLRDNLVEVNAAIKKLRASVAA